MVAKQGNFFGWERLERWLVQLVQLNTETHSRLERLEAEMKGLKAETGELGMKFRQLRADVDQLKADESHVKTGMQQLKANMEELKAGAARLHVHSGNLLRETEKLKENLGGLKSDVAEIALGVRDVGLKSERVSEEVSEGFLTVDDQFTFLGTVLGGVYTVLTQMVVQQAGNQDHAIHFEFEK
jgi:uncharacterized protein YoxC